MRKDNNTEAILNKDNKDKLMNRFFNRDNFNEFKGFFKTILTKYKIELEKKYEYN